jgi:hypothetical protein
MQIKVSLAWWLTPYLCGVAFMCAFTGRECDEDKVKRVINRALRFKVLT